MVGGKGESFANIGEGLATGLQCFEDLQIRREPNTASQKHCILICNSPPYQTMIQETYKFAGHTIEQLATIYQEVSDVRVTSCKCLIIKSILYMLTIYMCNFFRGVLTSLYYHQGKFRHCINYLRKLAAIYSPRKQRIMPRIRGIWCFCEITT